MHVGVVLAPAWPVLLYVLCFAFGVCICVVVVCGCGYLVLFLSCRCARPVYCVGVAGGVVVYVACVRVFIILSL